MSTLSAAPSSRRCTPLRSLASALLLLFLSACTPHYDWREVRAEDVAWSALFPDKVQTQTRSITLAGQPLNMTMTAARADDVTFAVATVELEPSAAEALQRMRDQLLDAMLRNIQGVVQNEQSEQSGHNAMLARLEQGQAPVVAKAVTAHGKMGDKAALLAGRFAAYTLASGKARAIQMIVLGPQDVLTRPAGQQAIETFMTSVRVQ